MPIAGRSPQFRTAGIISALMLVWASEAAPARSKSDVITNAKPVAGGKGNNALIPMFADKPGAIYRGPRPGRDPLRREMWKGVAASQIQEIEADRRMRQIIERGEVSTSLVPATLWQGSLVPFTDTLSGGQGIAGEGSAAAGVGGTVNTRTGNKATSVSFAGWTSRGDMNVPFTLVHNSTGTFNGSVGKGWSHSYEAEIAAGSGVAVVRMPDGLSIPFTLSGGIYTAPAGRYERLTALGSGAWTLKFKDRMVWNFNSTGLLTSMVDRSGNTVSLTRNTAGQLTKVTDPVGRILQFTYNAGNRIETVTDPMSRVWTLGYNTNGNLTSILYPSMMNGSSGNPTRTYAYDAADRITWADPRSGDRPLHRAERLLRLSASQAKVGSRASHPA